MILALSMHARAVSYTHLLIFFFWKTDGLKVLRLENLCIDFNKSDKLKIVIVVLTLVLLSVFLQEAQQYLSFLANTSQYAVNYWMRFTKSHNIVGIKLQNLYYS